MRLDSSKTVAGVPMLTVREVLRRLWDTDQVDVATATAVCDDLGIGARRIGPLLRQLEAEGYLEPGDERRRKTWLISRKGAALTWANATKPIRRATAERLLTELLDRVRVLEDWAQHPFAFGVSEVIVFGSYLTDSPDLGDVDVAIELRPRYSDRSTHWAHQQQRISAAKAEGKVLRTFAHELGYPELEVWQYLRAGKRSLSLIDLSIKREFVETVPRRVVYTAVDRNSIPSSLP